MTQPTPQKAAPAAMSDEQIDAVFDKFAGRNDCGTPYLRTYREGFRHIASAILEAQAEQSRQKHHAEILATFAANPELVAQFNALELGSDDEPAAQPAQPTMQAAQPARWDEVCAAWGSLPDELRKHPGLTRLYRALGGPQMEDVGIATPAVEAGAGKSQADLAR